MAKFDLDVFPDARPGSGANAGQSMNKFSLDLFLVSRPGDSGANDMSLLEVDHGVGLHVEQQARDGNFSETSKSAPWLYLGEVLVAEGQRLVLRTSSSIVLWSLCARGTRRYRCLVEAHVQGEPPG